MWEAVQHLILEEIITKLLALSDPQNKKGSGIDGLIGLLMLSHNLCRDLAPIYQVLERPLPLSGAPTNRIL